MRCKLLAVLILTGAAWAQPIPAPAVIKGTPPGSIGGACTSSQPGYLQSNGLWVSCVSSVWTQMAGGVGPAGATGAAGPGYKATSTTSLVTAGSGSKSFTTQSGLAYTVGARMRATSAGTGEYMEGLVTSYSGTTLVATMDTNSGTGTHTDWNINVSGNVGATGATGPTGATGATGPAGANGTGNNTFCADTTVSTTTYVCASPTPTVTTLTGLIVSFKPQTTNTGTSTLNVAGLGAKTLKASDGSTDISSGQLVGGTTYSFSYDGTNLVQTSSAGSGGTPGGSNGQLQYNNSGAFGGTTAIPNGDTATTQSVGDNTTKVANSQSININLASIATYNPAADGTTDDSAAFTTACTANPGASRSLQVSSTPSARTLRLLARSTSRSARRAGGYSS